MTFEDTFLTNDTDAMEETCIVEVPGTTTTDEDEWGIGASTPPTPTPVTLPCMEIPSQLFVDRAQGIEGILPLGLCILDENNIVAEATRIQYNTNTYQVTSIIEAVEHGIKRLVLNKVS